MVWSSEPRRLPGLQLSSVRQLRHPCSWAGLARKSPQLPSGAMWALRGQREELGAAGKRGSRHVIGSTLQLRVALKHRDP